MRLGGAGPARGVRQRAFPQQSTTQEHHSGSSRARPRPPHAGKDATQDFEEIGHSNSAKEQLAKYLIGEYEVRTLRGGGATWYRCQQQRGW